jgi:hypothetical protein
MPHRTSLLSAALSTAIGYPVAAQEPLWARQIGTAEYDIGYSVVADAAGNVFVGGSTEGTFGVPNIGSLDTYLIKYDGLGTQLWTRQIGTPPQDYCHGLPPIAWATSISPARWEAISRMAALTPT